MTKLLTQNQLLSAWTPSESSVQRSHIAALLKELNLDSYAALYRWSIQHRAEFWALMVEKLGIRLRTSYTTMLDLSGGIAAPKWLVDAHLNIVESCFQAPADAPALYYRQHAHAPLVTWSYADLHCLTQRVAHRLVAAGFQPGDAIAIVLPMNPESVAIYLGIIAAGCVVVSIADSFAAPEIANRLRLANAKAIFTQDVVQRAGQCFALYQKIMDAAAPPAVVLASNSSQLVDLRPGDRHWLEFLSDPSHFEAIAVAPTAPINILFSSGTTGEPKAIPWTQTTPIKCAADGYLHQDIHPGDVVAWPTNLGWMMGPWLIFASLINQATIALYGDVPTERGFGQFVQDAEVTLLGVVPSVVSIWQTTDCMEGLDWSAIKAFSSTGESSNSADMLYLMSLAGSKPVIEYCGGTEIGGAYLTGTLVQPAIPATFSTPTLGLEIVLLDEAGNPADRGEVFIVPPSLGLSTELLHQDHYSIYFADTPEPSGYPLPLRRHGDQLERLANGYYRSLGRIDDTMNLGGIKISAVEIEQVLNRVDEIQETAAIAIAPPAGGPCRLVIYAVVTPEHSWAADTLKLACQTALRQQLNPLFKIYDLVKVDVLPRSASHKLMRRLLRDRYQQTMGCLLQG